VVTSEPSISQPVREEIERRGKGRTIQTMVVIPALVENRFQHAAGDVDDAIERASQQRDEVADEIEGVGSTLITEPRIGDSDPLLAVEDGLREFPADEILIVTRPEGQAGWMEEDLFERAREKFDPPIAHFIVDASSDDPQVLDKERAGRGTEEETEESRPPHSNLPRFSSRDLAGMAVAIVGTLVLFVIAASCDEFSTEQGLTTAGLSSCAATLLIAGVVALANVTHVVGLLLFQTTATDTAWQRVLSYLSLYGTIGGLVAAIALHVLG
jgi:hypothetical protein